MNLKPQIPHARWVESPFFDERSSPEVSLLVIHAISLPPDTFGGEFVEALFTGKLNPSEHPYFATIAALKVSAHFYIKRSGELLQFVHGDKRAWHAGASSFEGRERCNDFSIGVELEGCDTVPFTSAQYETASTLAAQIMRLYPDITLDRIVGHEHIAPGRKTDPGPFFDWVRFKAAVRSAVST